MKMHERLVGFVRRFIRTIYCQLSSSFQRGIFANEPSESSIQSNNRTCSMRTSHGPQYKRYILAREQESVNYLPVTRRAILIWRLSVRVLYQDLRVPRKPRNQPQMSRESQVTEVVWLLEQCWLHLFENYRKSKARERGAGEKRRKQQNMTHATGNSG